MTDQFSQRHRPVEIRLKREEKTLEVDFEDGRQFSYPAEFLRVESPSAEVQGHGPGQKTLIAGRRHVGIMEVRPVGNYAICIKFDDLHDTGIYSWDTLYKYGEHKDEMWDEYVAALGAAGMSRDPK
jgi:DUF971 family protein